MQSMYVLCYKTMSATAWSAAHTGWSMGASTGVKTTYSFEGKFLIVTNNWKTQSERFNHIPWIPRERKFTIDTQTKSVVVSGESINTQR